MRLTSIAFALALVCGPAVNVHAAPINSGTYYFNNTVLNNGPDAIATVTGSVTFLNLNQVLSTDFVVTANGASYSFVQNTPTFHFNPAPRDNAVTFIFTDTPAVGGPSYTFGLTLAIFNNSPTPFDLDGATLCPFGGGCRVLQSNASTSFTLAPGAGGGYTDTTGNLQATPPAAAATPEPSTLALLGTGTLGLFSVARRKFRAA